MEVIMTDSLTLFLLIIAFLVVSTLLYIISNSIVLPFINKRRRKNQKICLNIYFYYKL